MDSQNRYTRPFGCIGLVFLVGNTFIQIHVCDDVCVCVKCGKPFALPYNALDVVVKCFCCFQSSGQCSFEYIFYIFYSQRLSCDQTKAKGHSV